MSLKNWYRSILCQHERNKNEKDIYIQLINNSAIKKKIGGVI